MNLIYFDCFIRPFCGVRLLSTCCVSLFSPVFNGRIRPPFLSDTLQDVLRAIHLFSVGLVLLAWSAWTELCAQVAASMTCACVSVYFWNRLFDDDSITPVDSRRHYYSMPQMNAHRRVCTVKWSKILVQPLSLEQKKLLLLCKRRPIWSTGIKCWIVTSSIQWKWPTTCQLLVSPKRPE